MPKLVIGIDLSTTACKAIAWSNQGQNIDEGRAEYNLLQPKPNWYEQNAEDWWQACCSSLRQVAIQIDIKDVEALCIAHQRESIVPVDDHGEPLYNAILWMDGRSNTQVEYLKKAIDPEKFHGITGKPLNMNPSISKILWLMQNKKDVFQKTYKILDTHGFLVYRLTGRFCTSLASADPMGIVDMKTHKWSSVLFNELGLKEDYFACLYQPGVIIGTITSKAADATGLPSGLPVISGGGDGQLASLGANALIDGRMSLNLGTAVVSGIVQSQYQVDRAFRTLYSAIPGHYSLETVIQSGMFTVDWFFNLFNESDNKAVAYHSFEKAAAEVPPGSLGLMVVPYWNQVMTPYWDPKARGITIGWTGAHKKEHFHRAIIEGIGFEQRMLGDAIKDLGIPLMEYSAIGGGSRSNLICQIIANVTGIPLVRTTTSEATCLGAGILAATASGWYSSITEAAEKMTNQAERFEPDDEIHLYYDHLYKNIYKNLYPSLQSSIHKLSELQ